MKKFKLLLMLSFVLINSVLFSQTLYVPGGTASGIGISTVTGNIGINAASPSEKLEIGGYDKVNIRVGQWATLGITGSHLATVLGNNVKASSTVNNMEILTSTVDGAKAIKMQYNEGITFHTLQGTVAAGNAFSSERMRIDNSGNVGIGISSPGGKLHVDGSTYIANENGDGLYRVSVGASGGNYGSIGYGYKYTLNSNEYRYAVPDFVSQLEFASGGFTFKTAPVGSVSNVVNFSAAVRIQQNGNVGIGTANPDQKLTVKGVIHAEEVRVDMTVPGPDYVFEKDYNLLPLSELETYIIQNKHLPEVPSANEMEADGLNLKEMNLLLLKKVEELTLHLIEMKKVSQIQSNEIEILKSKLK